MIGLKVRQIPDVGEPKDFMFEDTDWSKYQ